MTGQRTKVIHVITKLDVGGAQETALAILASLDPVRFDVLLVCGPETGSAGSLHKEAQSLGVEIRVVRSLVRRISPIRDAWAVICLHRLFRREQPDVVHTHSSKAGVIGRLAGRLAGVRTVMHSVHGWSFRPCMHPILYFVAVFIERLMAKTSNKLVVVAERDRIEGLAHRIGSDKMYLVIRSGIKTSDYAQASSNRSIVRQQLGVPVDAPLIGSVMRLAPPKDPETFLRAAAAVSSCRHDAYFLLVGDGPRRSSTEDLVAQLGLTDRVILTGLRRDVSALLGSLDAFVLASTSEGLPRTVTEAMASSVPVIANDVGGVSEVVEDGRTGLLVPPKDVDAMASAILRLIEDPDLAGHLRRQALARVQDFDVAVMSRAYRSLYLNPPSTQDRRFRPPSLLHHQLHS